MPKHTHVVILYGQEACDEFETMVRYFQTALDPNAWERLCFVCACPNISAFTPPSASLPPQLLWRPAYVGSDGHVTLDRQTIELIHTRCVDYSIYFHIVCDDFKRRELNNASIPTLLHGLKLYFEEHCHLVLYAFIYLHLEDSAAAREMQREFAKALLPFTEGNVYPYLLTRLLDDATPCREWHTWRATMCEILAVLSGNRSFEHGRAYSLGYTSLNANDEELYALRWNALCEAFARECGQPLSESDVWYLLTGERLLSDAAFGNEPQMRDMVDRWLNRLAEANLHRPDAKTLHNFHQLAGIAQQQNLSEIKNSVFRFYKLNFLKIKSAETIVHKHMDNFLEALASRSNAACFPTAYPSNFLDKLRYTLNAIVKLSVETSEPVPPEKKGVKFWHNYAMECCAFYEAHCERVLVRRVVAEYARAFLAELARVEEFISNAKRLGECLSSVQSTATAQMPKQSKYPKYTAAIANTLLSYKASLFANEKPLFDVQSGAPLPEALRALLIRADDLLHAQMPSGFNSTFIDAIRTEFDTQEKLSQFLNNYLSNRHRMFNSLYEPVNNPESLNFFDGHLAILQGKDRHVPVDNDNVEQINRYVLTKKLAFYVGSEIEPSQNAYFGDADAATSGSAWSDVFPDAVSPTQPQESQPGPVFTPPAPAQPAAPAAMNNPNPHNIGIRRINGQYLLVWEWLPGLTSLKVILNEQKPALVTIADYNLSHGYVVSQKLKYGRNDVKITSVDGKAIYGVHTFPGLQAKVRYNLSGNGTLVVENIGPKVATLVLCESIDNRTVYYPLYHIPADKNNRLRYSGLHLRGKASLQCDPNDAYPIFSIETDYSL